MITSPVTAKKSMEESSAFTLHYKEKLYIIVWLFIVWTDYDFLNAFSYLYSEISEI